MTLRGTGALVLAKGYFLVAGYALVLSLVRLLGPADYGRFVVVNGVLSVLSTLVIASTLKSVSRHVATTPDGVPGVRAAALKVQTCVALGIVTALWVAAPSVAAWLAAPELTPAIRVAAFVPGLYAIYAAHIGVINGRHLLGRQAIFDASFATLKLGAMAGAAWLGLGTIGVFGGFAAAVLVILPAAHVASRSAGERAPFPWRLLVAFSAATLVFEAGVAALHQASTFLVQRALGAELTGLYGAALQIARVSMQINAGLTLAALPAVAVATTGDGGRAATSAAIDRAYRYSILLAGTIAAVVAGNAAELTPVLVGPRLAAAAGVVVWAAPAYLCFALWVLGASLLVGSGRPRVAAAIGCAVLVLEVVLVRTRLAALAASPGDDAHDALVSVALASWTAHAVGLVLVTVALRGFWGWMPSWRVARMAVAVAATLAVAARWRTEGAWVIVESVVEAGIAVVLALALRAFTPEERARLGSFRRRRPEDPPSPAR